MSEVAVAIETHTPVAAERLDQLARGLADDLRAVRGLRVGNAGSTAIGPGKSPQAWELGMLVVGGLFSATTMRTIAQIAISYAERAKARSIRLRRGDVELVITGASRIDDPALVAKLEQIFGAGAGAGAGGGVGAGEAPPAIEGNRAGEAGR
ncbi:hypothetical protein BDK92_1701 [Micromonospora pisi]|uniref:Uncharacterized protein n=1 Tax=Micromonospora pisi TaxID=589240 RepID=A0A495JET3_9ACTN|nr:hypothetical protein [Micromonospora pisi]RKR87425.1 hypothetical protein BDK92_1701 [Micromonospora pisi]